MTKSTKIRIVAYGLVSVACISMFLLPYVAAGAAELKKFVNLNADDIFFFGLVLFLLMLFWVNSFRGGASSDDKALKLQQLEKDWRYLGDDSNIINDPNNILQQLEKNRRYMDDGSDIFNDPINANLHSNIFHHHKDFGKHTQQHKEAL